MGINLPRSLRFVRPSLSNEEVDKWLGWYNHLANPDRRNVGKFLRQSYDWMNKEAEELRQHRERFPSNTFDGNYFIIAAIGSTLTGTQYNDIDFLVVTDRIWRDMGSFEEDLLEQKLSRDFECKIDTSVSEAYSSFCGRPNRTIVTLNPRQGNGKNIHVSFQPEIRSETDWIEKDGKPSVLVYRRVNAGGY